MRCCVVLLFAAACGPRAIAPGVGAPHVAPPAHVTAVQPTFASAASAPSVHVSLVDPTHQISETDRADLTAHLAHAIARDASDHASGYTIAATISSLSVASDHVACSVSISIAPHDGVELEVNRTALARGSAIAIGGSGEIRACIATTIDEVIARQVLPFLRRRSSILDE